MKRALLILSMFLTQVSRAESIFLPPPQNSAYQKALNELSVEEKKRLRGFGLRLAALDPTVWAILTTDKTDNRDLVPIRPYYLRASEDPTFALSEVHLAFSFKKVIDKELIKHAYVSESIIDIGFAGEYERSNNRTLKNRGYFIRLSAMPTIPSGLYYRSSARIELLQKLPRDILRTNEPLDAKLEFTDSAVTLSLNGAVVLKVPGTTFRHGLVSLTTGWNPIRLQEFSIRGFQRGKEEIFKGVLPKEINKE